MARDRRAWELDALLGHEVEEPPMPLGIQLPPDGQLTLRRCLAALRHQWPPQLQQYYYAAAVQVGGDSELYGLGPQLLPREVFCPLWDVRHVCFTPQELFMPCVIHKGAKHSNWECSWQAGRVQEGSLLQLGGARSEIAALGGVPAPPGLSAALAWGCQGHSGAAVVPVSWQPAPCAEDQYMAAFAAAGDLMASQHGLPQRGQERVFSLGFKALRRDVLGPEGRPVQGPWKEPMEWNRQRWELLGQLATVLSDHEAVQRQLQQQQPHYQPREGVSPAQVPRVARVRPASCKQAFIGVALLLLFFMAVVVVPVSAMTSGLMALELAAFSSRWFRGGGGAARE